ncbi:TetR family transcriptional regulator [Pseudoclavibacter sp. AY1H1]|nr:TetR family transcriptional regulator [Pseudoclavibacter sp. AY1H1]
MSSAAASTRPGGRSARVLNAIYTAVGELVGEGTERVTFPLIAERAGVNPTTLYRRWDDVDALLEEVSVAALTREGDQIPDTGALETDLTEWALIITKDIARPHRTRYLRAMVAARTETVSSCPVMERRRDQAAEMVRRASGRGQAAPTVGQILDHIVAPLYHHVVFALPVDEEYARRLVRDVLLMVR